LKTQHHLKIMLTAIALMAGVIGVAQGQQRSEEALLLEATQKALAEARIEAEQAGLEVDELKQQVKSLGSSLADANRLGNEFRDDYNKLRLETEALGLETLTRGDRGVRERLLKAISDHRLLEEERETMAHALLDLADAIKSYMITAVSSNVETRAALQAALKQAEAAIGIQQRRPVDGPKKSLDEGKIVSIKRDLGIIVFNVGSKDGAKIGMPFEIVRKDRKIGTAMIADVRENRCGALITNLIDDSDDAQVGDRVRVQTQKNL
jgi:hypothetical protein